MRDDLSAWDYAPASDVSQKIYVDDRAAELGDIFVSAGVVRMDVSVDDEPDWPVRHGADSSHHLVAHRGEAAVHQQDAILAGLQSNVPTGAGEDVDVTSNGEDMNFTCWLSQTNGSRGHEYCGKRQCVSRDRRSHVVRHCLTELLHHAGNDTGGRSASPVEFFHQGLRNFFLTLSLAVQRT